MPIQPTPELQQRLGRLEFLANQAVEGFITGMHKSPFHGFSVEFAEHRLHNPGESTKHLDWKLYARTDKMFVKRYEEETNLRCQIVLDASRSMAYPDGVTLDDDRMSKLKFAVLASAAPAAEIEIVVTATSPGLAPGTIHIPASSNALLHAPLAAARRSAAGGHPLVFD